MKYTAIHDVQDKATQQLKVYKALMRIFIKAATGNNAAHLPIAEVAVYIHSEDATITMTAESFVDLDPPIHLERDVFHVRLDRIASFSNFINHKMMMYLQSKVILYKYEGVKLEYVIIK